MTTIIVVALALVGCLAIVYVLGVLLDAWLEKRRPTPDPQKRAVVGESHKPWM